MHLELSTESQAILDEMVKSGAHPSREAAVEACFAPIMMNESASKNSWMKGSKVHLNRST